jgi:hypothetical protein
MSITRMLLLGSLGLGACASPTGPDESRTSLPTSDEPQVGHFHPIGSTCRAGVMSSQLCALTSGKN